MWAWILGHLSIASIKWCIFLVSVHDYWRRFTINFHYICLVCVCVRACICVGQRISAFGKHHTIRAKRKDTEQQVFNYIYTIYLYEIGLEWSNAICSYNCTTMWWVYMVTSLNTLTLFDETSQPICITCIRVYVYVCVQPVVLPQSECHVFT